MRVLVIAGEPSGDVLGARLITALRRKAGDQPVEFFGVGGPRMEAVGLASLFPMSDIAVMGVAEVLPRLRLILKRMGAVVEAIRTHRPDAVVTIDAPDFCFRVAKRCRPLGIPFIHYVAPSVWAWRPGRAKKVARSVDHLMALLPFEPPYFEREGVACTFVGHPVVESGADAGLAERFRARHGLAAGQPLVVVLPGSRRGEIGALLPVFADTLRRLRETHPGLAICVPTLPHWEETVRNATRDWPFPVIVVTGDEEKFDAFAASHCALACSGTVALELALARVPAVVAYKVHPLTAWAVRRLIRIKYVNLVNIMLERMLVPELLQQDCRPDRLAAAIAELLDSPTARDAQIAGLHHVAAWLGAGGAPPSERAADVVLAEIGARRLVR
ncbi:MAG TPA: lipid-A-disaccharide synthase [Azospirillaceae bacterium]|nr:lipid-A-disaccharide synthase [Azospirillaceae bacterium]